MPKIYKMLFTSTIIASTLISVSSNSWLGMWLGLEINLLSIIPLMHNKSNSLTSEASIKYFIVQAIASTIILLSIISLSMKSNMLSNTSYQSSFLLMMNSSLLTKMGMAPFHFWFPEVMEGLDWLNCMLILTWQKLAPLVLLMYNMNFSLFMSSMIMASMVISGILGINQISLRKILAYSSINHMGWMISSMMVMETVWMYYFLIYTMITVNMILILKKLKIFFLNQLFQSMNSSIMTKLFFMMNFLSLSGIPPFLGFMPKWLTIQALINMNIFMLPTMMIISTLITIFMYIRISLSTLLMNTNEPNWSMKMESQFEKFYLSMSNFIAITSLTLVTVLFNIL